MKCSQLAEALFLVFADGREETLFLPTANTSKRASASKESEVERNDMKPDYISLFNLVRNSCEHALVSIYF